MKSKMLLLVSLSILQLHAQWEQCNGPYISHFINKMSSNGTDIYAATSNGVFKTTDDGSTWTDCNNGLPAYSTYRIYAFGGDIYVSVIQYPDFLRIYKSTDDGASWTQTQDAFAADNTILGFASQDSTLYTASAGLGIMSTTDGGTTWNPVNTGLPDLYPSDITANSTRLFAATSSGVYYSTDEGANWQPCNTGIPVSDQIISVIEAVDTVIYCYANNGSSGIGVYVSTDNGNNWSMQTSGITHTYATDFCSVGSYVYLSTQGGGIFRTTNQGANWTMYNDGLSLPNVFCLEKTATTLFAGTGNAIGWVFRNHFSAGIEENVPFSLTAFPNPTTGKIRIEAVEQVSSLSIINSFGTTVYQSKSPEGTSLIEVDLTGMAPGIYFVALQNRNGTGYGKIILE